MSEVDTLITKNGVEVWKISGFLGREYRKDGRSERVEYDPSMTVEMWREAVTDAVTKLISNKA